MDPAVERLYEVFAAPRPAKVDHCAHCVAPERVEPFTTVPLRELTAEQVEAFWLKSGTMGDEGFVRYLLPRFMQLIASGEIDARYADYYLGLVSVRYPGWTAAERAAIDAYFTALESAPELLAELVLAGAALEHLSGPGPLAALERAALEGPDPAGRLSDAHQILEELRVR